MGLRCPSIVLETLVRVGGSRLLDPASVDGIGGGGIVARPGHAYRYCSEIPTAFIQIRLVNRFLCVADRGNFRSLTARSCFKPFHRPIRLWGRRRIGAQAREELADIAWDLPHAGAIYPEIPRQDRLFDSRLYSCVREDMLRFTDESRFYGARLNSGLGERETRRRSYFLDPWHNPYWICMKGHGPVQLYCFVPNRRLETLVLNEERVPHESDLKGDDISFWIDNFEHRSQSPVTPNHD